MKVTLLHHTPLHIASTAIRKCWSSEDKSDTTLEYFFEASNALDAIAWLDHWTGKKDKELIERVGNKYKHSSTLEHLVYSLDIDGISRACLQELVRHRIAGYSVKSTRYVLAKELTDEEEFDICDDDVMHRSSKYVVFTDDEFINEYIIQSLEVLRKAVKSKVSNDKVKYVLPEAFKTSLVMTINARSLQNFLSLRSDKSALWEIQELAHNIYETLPTEHKYLFEDFLKEKQ